jgi:anti-sigma factor RsiW
VHTRHVHLELIDYLENVLEEPERRRIADHLDICEECRADMETIASVLSGLRSAPVDAPPKAYFTNFLPRLRERLVKKQTRQSAWYLRAGFFAAPAISLMILIFLFSKAPELDRSSVAEANLRPIISNLSSDDIAEVMGTQVHGETLSETENTSVYNTVIKKQYSVKNVVKSAIDDKSVSPALNETDYQSVIESLNDRQVDNILARLKERTLL